LPARADQKIPIQYFLKCATYRHNRRYRSTDIYCHSCRCPFITSIILEDGTFLFISLSIRFCHHTHTASAIRPFHLTFLRQLLTCRHKPSRQLRNGTTRWWHHRNTSQPDGHIRSTERIKSQLLKEKKKSEDEIEQKMKQFRA